MRKAYVLLIISIWVTVLPYLGFPYSWKDFLTTVSGLGLFCFSYILYKEYQTKDTKGRKTFDNFSENGDFSENKTEESEYIKQKEM